MWVAGGGVELTKRRPPSTKEERDDARIGFYRPVKERRKKKKTKLNLMRLCIEVYTILRLCMFLLRNY